MSRFFLPIVGILLLLTATASAQTTVSVIGTVIPGDCVVFNSTTVIKDAGVTCNSGGGSGSPGGSSGQVQFNNAGSFGGLTNAQLTALVQTFTSALSGAVPASGGGTANFLRADGNFAAPPGAVTSVFTRSGAVVAANGDYNAGQITYTPQGTGAVATTVAAELNRTIWVNDYGAVCNGSTDDHVAFQNAINEGQTIGSAVKFSAAVSGCAITTPLSITSTLDFSGDTYVSTLLPPGTNDAIDIVSTPAVYLHDFTITYSSTPTTTSAITVSAPATFVNNGSRFWNLTINSAFIGVNYLNADIWSLSNSIIASSGITNGSAVHVADSVNADAGDNTIYGNTLQAGPGGIVINWVSSGGLRVQNNKLLSNSAAVGIQFSLASGGINTSDVIITGNSIEGFQTSGSVGISFGRQGTTGSLGNIIIANNQIGAPMFCILHPTDANGAWTNDITVNGNICQLGTAANGVAVNIDSAQGVVVTNNNLISGAASDVATQIGSGAASATGCVVGPNAKIGSWVNSTIGTCTGIAPFL